MIMSPYKKDSRRLLLAALGTLSVLSLLKIPVLRLRRKTIACGPDPKTATETPPLRLLTRDGRLVEVDASRITVLKKKITTEELKDWVNRPS